MKIPIAGAGALGSELGGFIHESVGDTTPAGRAARRHEKASIIK